jgi:hypothetical protein
MIDAIFWSVEEIAAKAAEIYTSRIQQQVETDDNIGKMLTIDIETGEYFIDRTGVEGMMFLKAKRPIARLFTLRIGYSAAVGFGGLDGKLD